MDPTKNTDFIYPSDKFCILYANSRLESQDIFYVKKMGNFLTHQLLIHSSQIIIAIKNSDNAILFKSKHKFKIMEYQEVEKIHRVFLQIIIPFFGSDLNWVMSKGFPTLCIMENGFSADIRNFTPYNWISHHALGLDKVSKQLGVIIDKKLCSFGFSPNSQLNTEKILHLNKVSPIIQNFILGGLKKEEFYERNALYLGYTQTPNASFAFIGAIAKLHRDSTKNLLIIIPSNENTHKKIKKNLPLWLEMAKNNGLGHIQFEYYQHSNETLSCLEKIQLKSFDKSLRVLYGTFHQKDLKNLLLASEKETVISGDCALSEAVSANKNWFYETDSSKREFAYHLQKFSPSKIIEKCYSDYPIGLNECNFMADNFKKGQYNNYQMTTSLNEKIIDNDCSQELAQTIINLVNTKTKPITKLNQNTKISLEDFPKEKLVKVNGQQLKNLEIRNDTGISEAKGFKNISFESQYFGVSPSSTSSNSNFFNDSIYLVKRLDT